jgi:hypothetical protein
MVTPRHRANHGSLARLRCDSPDYNRATMRCTALRVLRYTIQIGEYALKPPGQSTRKHTRQSSIVITMIRPIGWYPCRYTCPFSLPRRISSPRSTDDPAYQELDGVGADASASVTVGVVHESSHASHGCVAIAELGQHRFGLGNTNQGLDGSEQLGARGWSPPEPRRDPFQDLCPGEGVEQGD